MLGGNKQIWRVKYLYLRCNLPHVLAFWGESENFGGEISPPNSSEINTDHTVIDNKVYSCIPYKIL